jgi:ferric-dicitrate binding protein FerR (iron transport regulator)
MMDGRHSNLAEQERWIREAIRSTGDVRADTVFRERLKREFIDGTISAPAVPQEEPRARSMPRWGWILVPAAAAAVLLFALFLPGPTPTWVVQAVHGEGQIEIDGQTLATGDPDPMARALGSGGRVRVPGGVSLALRLDDLLLLELVEGTDATMPAPPGQGTSRPLIAEVRAGDMKIMTGPGFPGTELLILTTEGRTEIVGSIVSVYKGDGYTCVCVLEGTAQVGTDEARLEEIPRGMLKIMFGDGSPSIVADIASQHEAELEEFDERYRDAFQPRE